ncbi:xanthine dehydrogenase accessory protein XdhC [Saccharospirillum mangrovi]|uniref:xanthine dehydrogenase accessory protein XdhC n=1 Tax=Saccharospirillum mangrovi TaxID=2161747 RepID=UPI000D39FE64|nr:xanthine dehydrogenase accessory protein XdhC [Saccharospirillum mangrovi]
MKRHWRWFEALNELQQNGEPLVLITVLATAGSTPRDAATKMVVTAGEQWDTIGGGNLEFQAIARARELLAGGSARTEVEQIELGASRGQCCGGAAQLLFEVLVSSRQPLAIFGAGHVAQRLLPILAPLDLQLSWIDSRPDWLADAPAGVTTDCLANPVDAIADLPEHSWVLILTHNHQLDFELVQAALKRPDIGYLGVIGSATKAKRFRQRLAHRGWSQADIERMLCPVGVLDIPGKRPAEVAVSIAAQLIQRLHANTAQPAKKATGLNWPQSRSLNQEPSE